MSLFQNSYFYFLLIALWCGFLCGTPIAQAGLYKSIGPDGETVYTDFPVNGGKELKPSDLPELSTYSPNDLPLHLVRPPTPAPAPTVPPPDTNPATATYSHFSIIAPRHNDTLQNIGDTPLMLNLALAPSLKIDQGHRIQLSINGLQQTTTYTSLEIPLPHLNRGENMIRARIIDNTGKEIIATAVISVHVKQASIQHQTPTVGKPPQPKPRQGFNADFSAKSAKAPIISPTDKKPRESNRPAR